MSSRSEDSATPDRPAPYAEVRGAWQDNPRRVVVTGAGGFIGSHLVEVLVQLGQDVLGVDNFSTGRRENAEELARVAARSPGSFELREADIRDFEACLAFCEGADVILHQAALGSVPRSIENPAASYQSNADGFFNVVEAARVQGVPRVVFASSSSVYGDARTLPMQEGVTGRPLSPYAATKRINEIVMHGFNGVYDLAMVGLRYFNVFGPRQDPSGPYSAVIPRWTDALLAGKQPQIFGDGLTSRDFCPVANVVQANILAAERAIAVRGEVFNIALGQRTSLRELFEQLRSSLASRGVEGLPPAPEYLDSRPGDLPHSRADISHAQSLLGYAPELSFADGLDLTVEWAVSRRSG